ncbi:MAG: hypothetical protein Q8Q96_01290, partial [bacterium]|nr:hypothetical protein [bacterium]
MGNPVKRLWQFITSPDYSRTVSVLALLVVVLAIPLTVFIAQKQQEIRQRAQTIGSCRNLHPNDTIPPSIDGRGNAIDPNKYYWRALNCSESCFVTDDISNPENYNSKCAKNTLDPSVNSATSNWCYGFGEGNYRCLQLRSAAQPDETCNANTSCDAKAVNKLDSANDLSCRKIGNNDTAGVYTGGGYQWVTLEKGNNLCSSEEHRGRTARCGGQIYYCDPIGEKPGNWVTSLPPTLTATPTPTSTPTPTLTPTPIPVKICETDCKNFRSGSIENGEQCPDSYYIEKVSYDYNTQICDFRCTQIPDYGSINRKKANDCGYEAISKPPPPSSGDSGDGGGS